MERAREGRRGGGGVPVSAHRRPRTTGFKDSPVRDDDEITDDTHNPRLRERGKKDNLVSVISGTVLRNKRKMLEMQVPAQSSTVDDVDESSDDTDGGVSEEDDDPPPKIPRWYKPKSSKSHEEGIGLDLPAVPRKARSAIVKRHQESPQPPNTSTPPHQSSSSPAPSNKPSSSATLKPGRRMKSNGSKPRAAKVPKSSPAAIISEQEVEVAEALFDLARTAPNFQKDIKVEPSAFANASQSNVSIPQPAAAPHSAEAPKRKRPRVKPRSDDPTSSTRQGPANVPTPPRDDKGSRVQTSDRMRAESSSKPSVPAAGQSFGAAAAVISSAAVPNTQTPDSQCQDRRSDAATEKNKSSNTAEKRAADPTTPSSNPNPETNKRKFPSLSENRPPKFDIDLMAPPSTSLPLENAETAPSDADGKQPMELKNGSTEMSWLEKECERAREKEREAKGKDKEVTVEGSEVRKENEMFREDKDRECLDLNKQGMVGLRAVKTPRMDMKTAQKPDRSVSAAVVSAASSFLNAASSACATAPALMTWPGGLPSVGYFGPAAVAGTSAVNWPQSAPAANGTADEQALQMNSYVPGRLSWKRCAIHVFIARFIDMQQQLARHTPYGVATGLYTGKPYNLNIPADAMFGGNSTPAAGAAIVPAGSNVSSGVPAAANSQGPKVPYMDALFRKHPQQQQQQQQLAQPPPSLTLQTGPAFGFPVSQAGGGTSNNGGPAISAGLVPSSSGTVAAGGNATVGSPSLGGGGVNNSVATIAAQAQAQAHYFMQHPFPFTYPPSHYGSHNFNAAPNMGQQTTQYMNGPFYASHAMHPSQTPQQGGPTASSSHSTQKQSSRIFPQPQQQQQQVVSSPYNNSQQQVLPLPHAPHDKEVRETSDEKFPTLQRLLFGQQATTTAASPASSAALLGTDTLKTQCIQGGVGGQQATATATSPINLKSMDSNSVATVTRGSVGPGPLGLAPVAAVMAPQGHAVLHSQQHSLQQQQQQQQLQQQQQQPRQQTQAQRTCTEDNHGVTESRDLSEDRKLAVKRAPTIISRVDLESLPVGSPTNSSSRMANAAPAGGITGSVSSRLNIHQTPSNGPSSQSSKQPLVRSSSSKAASSAPPTQSQSTVASSFGDRNSFVPMTRGAGMSFPVQGPMPAQKQSQISQQQLKIQNQRPSVPATGQSVLPNSMQKNHQTQQSRSPQNAANATSSGPVPRISSATSGPPTSACVSMPVSQLPKQNSLVQKGAAPKGSFPVSQKPVSNNVSGKRSPQSTPQQYQSHLSQQQQQQQQQLQQQQQQQHQQQQQQLLQKQQQSLPQFQLRQQMFFQQHYLQQQQQQQHQQQQQPQQHFTSTQQSQLSQSQYQQQQQQQQQGQNGLTMTSQNLSLGAATGNGNHSKANSSSSSASAAAAAANMNARNSSASSLTSAPSTAQSQRALQAGSPNQQATAQVANLPPYTPLKSASSSSDQKSSDGNNQEQQQQQQQQRHRTMLSSSPVNPVRQQQTVTGSTEGYCNGTAAVTVNNYNASSSSCVDAKVNFVTATPSSSHHHQQQLQLQQLQEYVTGITGVSGCTSGSSSSTGLLGQQSSASALRP